MISYFFYNQALFLAYQLWFFVGDEPQAQVHMLLFVPANLFTRAKR